jgi:hypothetical protein
MLSWMLLRRGKILIVGLSIPEASLLTSTSASPFTGERMKWDESSEAAFSADENDRSVVVYC